MYSSARLRRTTLTLQIWPVIRDVMLSLVVGRVSIGESDSHLVLIFSLRDFVILTYYIHVDLQSCRNEKGQF